MDNYQNIKNEAIKWVQSAFKNALTKYQYHNWQHTRNVLRATTEIIEGTVDISKEEKEHLELAAIFHDIGFIKIRDQHELESATIAETFLKEKGFPEKRISAIKKIIAATEMGYQPTSKFDEIIQDADIAHLGKKSYATVYNNLYQEVKGYDKPDLSYEEWKKMCLDFFEQHTFHSSYAKEKFAPVKEQNKQKIMALENNTLPIEKKKKGKSKKDIPEKGIETMFRVSLRNHTNLSRIADNKANTLISVNAIIISIVLSTLFPKLDNNPNLIYPGISLLIVNIATIVVAILSVIPKTTHGIISKEQVEHKKGNLLFFGNFHRMSLDDFEWGIDEIMRDREYLYKTLTRDLFFLGKVLNRKYMFLRLGYYVFIIGLIVSIGLFMYYLKVTSF